MLDKDENEQKAKDAIDVAEEIIVLLNKSFPLNYDDQPSNVVSEDEHVEHTWNMFEALGMVTTTLMVASDTDRKVVLKLLSNYIEHITNIVHAMLDDNEKKPTN
jgi:hypothetical protein